MDRPPERMENHYELDVEGAYSNVADESESCVEKEGTKGVEGDCRSWLETEGRDTVETTDKFEMAEMKPANDGVYDDVTCKLSLDTIGLYEFVGAPGGNKLETDEKTDDQPTSLPQVRVSVPRGILYLVIGLSVVALLTAAISLVISVRKVVSPPHVSSTTREGTAEARRSDEREYIQELRNQIAQQKEDLNTINHNFQNLKRKITDMNYTQFVQLKDDLSSTVEGLNKFRNEAVSRMDNITEKQQLFQNVTVNELQQHNNTIANLRLQGNVDFGQCTHKVADSGVVSAGPAAYTDVSVAETPGKRIIGVTCSTNVAAEYILSVKSLGSTQYYVCHCRGHSAGLLPTGSMQCYLHYWECPLIK